jgi:predicted transcriptional regulator
MLNELTSKERELLFLMNDKSLTFREQKVCISYPSFWFATRKLKDFGLVNNSKGVWNLTEKGKKVSDYLKKIEEEMNK